MPFDYGWYPVALSRDVDPSTSTGALLLGKEIVVWRDEEGASIIGGCCGTTAEHIAALVGGLREGGCVTVGSP